MNAALYIWLSYAIFAILLGAVILSSRIDMRRQEKILRQHKK